MEQARLNDPLVRRAREMLDAEIELDIVALDVQEGRCFAFNETAAWVWKELELPRSRSFLQNSLLERFEIDERSCSTSLTRLLDDLCVRGLIRIGTESISL
jgi:hypothetical protein